MQHKLKIKAKYLLPIILGNKTFELRKDDRNYQVGDYITFEVIDSNNPIYLKNNYYQITYILRNTPEYGLVKDYCILAISKVS